MDKKNLVAFLSLSLAVLLLSSLLFPPPKQPPKKDGEQPKVAADDAARPADDAGAEDAAEEAGDDEQAAQGANPLVEAAENEVPLEFVSLGSLDRATGYRLLVTLTNQGAAVQRTELTSPRFLDLVDRSGYLGHLELEDTPSGVKVRVVGAGTPAALAGIQVGDIITAVERQRREQRGPVEVKSIDDFEAERSRTKPDQDFLVTVLRGDSGPQTVTVKLVRRPMEVTRPEIDNIRMRGGTLPVGFVDPPSFLTSVVAIGDKPLGKRTLNRLAAALEKGNWEVAEHDETSVTFARDVPGQKLRLVKRYTLEPVPAGSRDDRDYPGYNLRLDVEVQNTGDAAQSVAYRLDGPTGLPLEGWWYTHKISQRWFSAAGLRDVVVRFAGQPSQQIDCSTIAEDKVEPMGHDVPLAYVGVDAVYFSAVMIPVKASLQEDWFDSTEAIRIGPKPVAPTPLRFTNTSCRMTRLPIELAPGKSQRDSYQIFLGPKRPELLAQYKAADDPSYSLKEIIYYGMWPFGAVARGMLSILHFLYAIVGNFGIAIILLTVVVRGAMFPVSFRQTKNMARMQALKPELDRISEKYKTDMQKRSQAMQELYRKHKINPMGGCLPVFLQLPVFIGLYRSIMIDVELRQQPLFTEAIRWCSDLSAPDMFYNWSWLMPHFVNNGEGILGLGPYFNLLPIVTTVLFLVSMKMSMPEPANEQAAMQQKMMKYMTIFFGFMFFKWASGLCLYCITSTCWGMGERRLLTSARQASGPDSGGQSVARKANPPARGPANGSSNGSPGPQRPKEKRKR